KQAAQLGLRGARRNAIEIIEHPGIWIERLVLVLSKIVDIDFVAQPNLAARGRLQPSEQADQRGLACAVHSYQRNPVASLHNKVRVAEYLLGAVTLRQIFGLDYHASAGSGLREIEVDSL